MILLLLLASLRMIKVRPSYALILSNHKRAALIIY
nr:MAG TPA: hypothetical protein [Caudoviricetes sp.]